MGASACVAGGMPGTETEYMCGYWKILGMNMPEMLIAAHINLLHDGIAIGSCRLSMPYAEKLVVLLEHWSRNQTSVHLGMPHCLQ